MFFWSINGLLPHLASLSRIWDLSLEKDEEEEAEFKAQTKEQVNAPADLPPQLLFVHQVNPSLIYIYNLLFDLEKLVQPVKSSVLWL